MLAMFLSALADDKDKEFFSYIYGQYERKLYAVALNILKEPALAEDAVHECLVKVLNHFDDAKKIFSEGRRFFEGWIVTILKNTALDSLSKERRAEPLPEDWELPGGDGVRAENEYHALVELIRAMPEGCRAILELRLVSEWSFKEIGKVLGIREATAQARYSRGLKLLQQRLREEGYDYAGNGV